MRRAYKFMLLLYPRGHRDQFAEEMMRVFEEASAESRAQGRAWYVRFAFAEIAGLIGGAAGAWLASEPVPAVPVTSGSRSRNTQHELIEAQQRIDENIAGMVHAIANHQFERARLLSEQERQAREHLRVLQENSGAQNMEWMVSFPRQFAPETRAATLRRRARRPAFLHV